MNKFGKKTLSFLLAGIMVLSLTACGGSKKTATDPSATGKTDPVVTTGKGDTASKIDTSEHVKIVYMTTGDPKSNGATEAMLEKLNKILTDKVNAELEIYYIGWTDYLSNYNLTLAQMDGSVDLVGTATDWLDAWPNAQNGAFLELSEDMLATYAPQTYAQVPAEDWDKCKFNGNIYLMPEDNFTQWTNHGFIYRGDWAAEAGLTNGVHNWEDMTTYFQGVKKNHPDVIPWDSNAKQTIEMPVGWMTSHTNFVPTEGIVAGRIFGGTKDNLYTLGSPFYEGDELIEFAKYMKQWDEMGVWKTDVLNNEAAKAEEEMYLGQSASTQHHTNTWLTDVGFKMNTNQPGSDTSFFWFGEEMGNVVSLNITHGAMAVSAASKNPERALMVYDLLRNDPECYKLINYGIEGVQYEMTPEGYMKQPEGYSTDKDEIVTNYWWGRNDSLELKLEGRSWDKYDALCAEYDKVKIQYPYGQFIPDMTNIQAQVDNINEIHTNYMKQITYGKYKGTAEEIVAEYRKALKNAGFEEVLSELQTQMDALYK
ncbi:ABC transporter substrate-binding protein [Lachnoclostridium sp.]|uniref:ABC transporter substrate-binding protein n=1 Tax=Lachnoclostridium sp. TaxID=2028282 RepID=UPI0028986DD8|nr:DUF3502 domain-containing protein [Lachnoclostridium sp.]